MNTIEQLAQEIQGYFEFRTRDNGVRFTCLVEAAPDWLLDAVMKAHAGMMPDDYVYTWCADAVSAFADQSDPERTCEEVEAAPYNHELFDWVQSNTARLVAAEDTLANALANGWDGCATITQAISEAMREEKSSVYWSMLHSIQEQLEGVTT